MQDDNERKIKKPEQPYAKTATSLVCLAMTRLSGFVYSNYPAIQNTLFNHP